MPIKKDQRIDKYIREVGAFKEHCTFGFWKGSLIVKKSGEKANIGMGQLGKQRDYIDWISDGKARNWKYER